MATNQIHDPEFIKKVLFNKLSYLHSERIKFENTDELKVQEITKQINFVRSELKRCRW